jgi:hypothetical protein
VADVSATKAQAFFEMMMAWNTAESDMDVFVFATFGWPEEKVGVEPAPFGGPTYDWYDSSFELKGIKSAEWMPTAEQIQVIWDAGFARAWLCYADGAERYCTPERGIGEKVHRG